MKDVNITEDQLDKLTEAINKQVQTMKKIEDLANEIDCTSIVFPASDPSEADLEYFQILSSIIQEKFDEFGISILIFRDSQELAQALMDNLPDSTLISLNHMIDSLYEDKGILKCTYTSVWESDAKLTSPCLFNPETKEVECLTSFDSDEDLGNLIEDYVTLSDGTVIKDEFIYL